MKQQERQECSRQKIFRAAMEEFGQNNYDKVSMESICAKHHISKGMMYHYYSNKDDLFLLCVEDTFRLLQDYVEQGIKSSESAAYAERIQGFFEIREYFFQQYPMQKCIFENAMVHTPKHLEKEIQKLHQPIKEMNKCFLESVVENMPLRPGVEKQNAMQYLESMEYLLPVVIRSGGFMAQPDLHAMFTNVKEKLDMMLFGIIRQDAAISLNGTENDLL